VRGHKGTTSPLPLKPSGSDRPPLTTTRAREPAGERA
jgi:two-component system sensor histidine kinase MtrB